MRQWKTWPHGKTDNMKIQKRVFRNCWVFIAKPIAEIIAEISDFRLRAGIILAASFLLPACWYRVSKKNLVLIERNFGRLFGAHLLIQRKYIYDSRWASRGRNFLLSVYNNIFIIIYINTTSPGVVLVFQHTGNA